MILRILATAAVAFWPGIVLAACAGNDLLPSLTQAEQSALDARLAQTPYPTGNHWRATRDDLTIHLVGTIHIDDPRLQPHQDALAPVVASAETLLLEMTKADQADLMQAMTDDPTLVIMQDRSLVDAMAPADWDALADALQARDIPPMMGARMRPWYLSVILGLPPCLDLTTAADGGMDARLEAVAIRAGVQTAALEDALSLFSAFDAVPFETQLAMVQAAMVAPDAAEDMLETLMAAYAAENHAAVWILSGILADRFAPQQSDTLDAAFAAMETQLLDARNAAWIPVIVNAANQARGGHIVAAFGAAHLGGEHGVLALLEAEGFTLARQPF